MTINKSIFAAAGLLAGFLLNSCVSPTQEGRFMGWVDSSDEIEALASFVVDGETTMQEVLRKFGTPTASGEIEDGGNVLLYEWKTTTWVNPENKHEEVGDFFDPFDDGTVESRTFNSAWLTFRLDQDLVVLSHYIFGPEK